MEHRDHFTGAHLELLYYSDAIEMRRHRSPHQSSGYNRETILHIPFAEERGLVVLKDAVSWWDDHIQKLKSFGEISEDTELHSYFQRYPEAYQNAKHLVKGTMYGVDTNPLLQSTHADRLAHDCGATVDYYFDGAKRTASALDSLVRSITRRLLPIRVAQTGYDCLTLFIPEFESHGAYSVRHIVSLTKPHPDGVANIHTRRYHQAA